jgi:hypothetical protein
MRTLVRSPFVHLAHLLRPAALAASLLVAAGCASGGGGGGAGGSLGRPVAVSLIGYGPAPFQLVSESHTAPVELYSNEMRHASTKVQADEVMLALVEHLDDLGFGGYARPGHAPDGVGAGGSIAKAIQVEDRGESAWWPLVATASTAELQAFQTAVRDFLDVYNLTQSWQTIDNTLGGEYFERKKAGGN